MQPEDLRVEKTRSSALALGASALGVELCRRGIDTLVVVGPLSNVCCQATIRDAMMLNYRAVLVSDANAALSDEVIAALGNEAAPAGLLHHADSAATAE